MADILVGNIVGGLKIDATAWQQGLTQATQQLAQFQQALTSRLTPALQQTNQALAQTGTQAQALVTPMQAATRATSGFSTALQVAGGIGIATSIGAITSAVVAFGRETIQTGARLEQLRASLSAIAGSTAAGQQQFQFLTATAQQLGVALEPIARGWRTLTAAATQANLPLADQQRLLTALVTEGRRVGASNEEVSRAITAVAQSASKGKLSMEELRQQLGEALPTAFAAVARGMGRTTEELEKLIETGSVRFPAFARALTRGFEQMQASGSQMAETTQAAFNRLANAWTLLQDTIMKSGLNTYLVTVANNLREAVEWTTRLVGGRGAGTAGPTMGELGATPEQAAEIRRLQGIIGPYSRMAETAENPAHRAQYAAMVERTREQLDQLLAVIRGTQDQAAEQAKVTAELNKTNTQRELEADYVADVTRKFGDLRKAQEDFRKEAALSPERLGRPGTAEFLQGMEAATRKQLEDLTKLVAQPPQGVTLPDALRQQLAAADTQFGQLGRMQDALRDKERERARAEREAAQEIERDTRERRQQVMATGQEYLRALEAEIRQQEQAFEQLTRLAESYGMTKQARDADTASTLEAALATSQYAEEALRLAEAIRASARMEAQVPELRRQAASSALAFAQSQQEQAALRTLEENLEQARIPRGVGGFPFGRSREELRLQQRTGEDIRSEAGQRRAQELRQALLVQERLNYAAGLFADFGASVGNAWTQALTSIADQTQTVAQAFQAMARSIIQSLGQIAAQEGFKALIGLGVRMIAGAAVGGGGTGLGVGLGGESASAVGAGINPVLFQHGGIVRAPTLAMLGEGPSSTLPEYVMNKGQMEALMARGSASGQQSPVSIHNYPDKAAAEEGAAQAQARGERTIINAVLRNLSAGESSTINRAMRALQR